MTDLTERLRNQNLMWASDRYEAADRIEALTAREAELVAQVEALTAELDRRDRNETRNCLNWGPCSRHDGRMDEAAYAGAALEAKP